MTLNIENASRIVVGGTRWIGDAVMTIPALRELRRASPNAHITLAAGRWANDVFMDADFIDEILIIENQSGNKLQNIWRQAQTLNKYNFHLAIIFQNSFSSALIPFLARVPHRAGYATDGRAALLTHRIRLPAWRATRHEIYYYLNIINELHRRSHATSNIKSRDNKSNAHRNNKVNDETYDFNYSNNDLKNPVPSLNLNVSLARQQRAREILRQHGATLARPLIVICPGSTNSRAKRWGATSYARLADCLINEATAEVAFIGAKEEAEVTRSIVAQMQAQPIILTGHTTLAESIAVLSLCDVMISNDTGPAHIAAALHRPTLVIFGPTNPLTTAPFSSVAEVIREPPACAPCMLRDCPIDHRCMTRISVERVFNRAVEILDNAEQDAEQQTSQRNFQFQI